EATQRVGHGDLSSMLAVRSSDELGILANSVNEMNASLAKTRQELENLTNDLERQVEDRTAALKSAQEVLARSEKLASLGQLSASIAHEINNPLAGILTFARLMTRMLESGPPDVATRAVCLKNLSLVQRETERCTVIVRNLLDFARARPLDLRIIDPTRALEEALSLAQHKMQLQGITVVKKLEDTGAVNADFGQLRQAFMNILLNACDAMPQGGTLTLNTHFYSGSREVDISVADTGAGIPPELVSRIFDPFFTTKEKGTGLGLSVVYGIVEKHGGSMQVESRVGKGTTMTIRLPLAEDGASRAAAAAT
ncbi:MAG TPA: ATP-binding protein, partial [Thermoanaerobaculia bacterium]|nr:ATP-binding protein [Thermoanaerobaculia bacterium]